LEEHRKDKSFHGIELSLRSFGGAKAVRVLHPENQEIPAHKHDWACITIPVLGGCRELFEGGDAKIEGPSAVFHPAGSYHGDEIGPKGLETVSIQFDPAWLGSEWLQRLNRSSVWIGGRVAMGAGRLAMMWTKNGLQECRLRLATLEFIHVALKSPVGTVPPWLEIVRQDVARPGPSRTTEIARRLALHPAWLARSYRDVVGEGLNKTKRRNRVGKAVDLLRNSENVLADVAAAAGFCDQSHMNRCFLEMLGRTPLQVRNERTLLKRMLG